MSHGSSKASWTAVLLCLAGITIGSIAMIPTPSWTLFTIGVVLTLASGPVGMIMAAAGMGVDRAPGQTTPDVGDQHAVSET